MSQEPQQLPRKTFGFWELFALLRLIATCFAIYAGYHYYRYDTLPFDLDKHVFGEKVPLEAGIPSGAPSLQVAFVKMLAGTYREYRAGQNEMAKGAVRPRRAKLICDMMRNRNVIDWRGWITDLRTNNDGWGIISIRIAPDIHVSTWNNSMSDAWDKTLIEPSSRVFESAVKMKVGELVSFSGTFLLSTVDCLREKSLTLAGSMNSPDFVFKFSDVSARH